MPDILIRNLDANVRTRLHERATENHRSLEEEVHAILLDAVSDIPSAQRNLAEIARECFAPLGGVELELPARGPMRNPPDFY